MRRFFAIFVGLFTLGPRGAEFGTPPRATEQLAPFPPAANAPPPRVQLLPPEIVHVLPAESGTLPPKIPGVVVSFNQPMRTTGVALQLKPAPPGQFRWIDPSTFAFEPKAGRLPLGTTFTATVPAGVKTAAGTPLPHGKAWTFSTARPAVEGSSPTANQKNVDPRKPLLLRFNGAMDPLEVARLSVLTAGGVRIPLKGSLTLDGSVELRPERVLPFASDCALKLPGSLRSTEGPSPIGTETQLLFRTADPLEVAEVKCRHDWTPCHLVQVLFNNPLPPQKLAAFVHIEPPARRMIASEEGITLEGDWDGTRAVTIQLAPGVRDVYGQTLAKPFGTTMQLERNRGQEGLRVGIDRLDAQEAHSIKALASNRSSAIFRAAAIPPAQLSAALAYALRLRGDWKEFRDSKEQRVSLEPSRYEQIFNLPLDGPGLWLTELVLDGTKTRDRNRTAEVVQVTSLGLIAAVDAQEIFAAVGTLRGNRPVAGARFLLYDEAGKLLAQADGNDQGFARLPGPDVLESWGPLLLVAEAAGDRCFEVLDRWFTWQRDLDASGVRSQRVGGLWTERGVYRPGEIVHAYAVVRERLSRGRYRIPKVPLHWVAESEADEKAFAEGDAAISAEGIAAFDLPLPADGRLGPVLLTAGQRDLRALFHVQEARVPEGRVSVSMREEPRLLGGVAHAEIAGETYSGAPMTHARLRWKVTAWSRWSPRIEGHSAYSFHFKDESDLLKNPLPQDYEREGEGNLDADGHLSLAVPLSRECGAADACDFNVEAEALDALQHGVAGRTGFTAFAAPVLVGVKNEWRPTPAGPRLLAAAAAVDTQGHELPLPVELRLFELRDVIDPGTGPAQEEIEIARAPAPASFAAPPGKRLLIRATGRDPKGNEVAGESEVYSSWREGQLELLTDRDRYAAGEVAHVTVGAPFAAGRGLLILDHAGVVESRLLEFSGAPIDVPLREEWIPGVRARLLLVSGSESASGEVTLNLGTETRRAQFSVGVDRQEAAPGDTVEITLRSPSRLGVVLSVVDEGALAMTKHRAPDPLASIYKLPYRGVALNDGWTDFPREPRWWDPDAFGGRRATEEVVVTGSRVRQKEPEPGFALRKNFLPTAHFAANLQLEPSVALRVRVKLPDQASDFHITAVGVDDQEAAHLAVVEAHVRTRLPLLLQAALPHFVNSGDTFDVAAVVHNLTREPADVEITAQSIALGLAGEVKRLRIAPNAEGEARFTARAGLPGEAKVRLFAAGGGHSDAVELAIPVLAPAAVETFAAYGVTENAVRLPLDVPPDALPNRGGLQISLASSALSGLEEAAEYLADYPYECVEQTASRLVALLAMRNLPVAHGGGEERIAIAIRRLEAMQLPSGAFTFWPHGKDESPFGTAWAAYALSLAAAADIRDADGLLSSTRDYLGAPHRGWPASARALGLLVRKERGAELDELYAQRASLSVFARALLFETLVRLKDDRAAALRGELDGLALETAGALHYAEAGEDLERAVFGSSERTDAAVLHALVAGEASGPRLDKLARALAAARKAGRWGNTQSNAWALLALSDYYRRFESVTPEFAGGVWLGEKALASHRFVGRSLDTVRTNVPLAEARGHAPLVMGKEGAGRLYYRLALSTYRPALAARSVEHGFAISRQLQDEHGRPLPQPVRLAAGQVVRIHLVVTVPDRRTYVAVADHLPAGLEPLDPAVATTAAPRSQATKRFWSGWDHLELRTTGGQAFADDLPAGTYVYDYFARATTRGHFRMAGPVVEEMYSPETQARGAAGEVVVE